MTKRKAAKIISKWTGKTLLVCTGIECGDCPLYPCNARFKDSRERKEAAMLWLKYNPSKWERIWRLLHGLTV